MTLKLTKKYTPYDSYTDSGVDWLGQVPEGWGNKKLKAFCNFTNGFSFKSDEWENEGIPIIRIQNLNGSENFNYYAPSLLFKKVEVKKGDLLFSWSGNVGTSFGPFLWDRDGLFYLNQHIFLVDTQEKIDKKWLYYTMLPLTRHVEDIETSGIIGMVHVTKQKLTNQLVTVPPLPTQQRIATYLDEKTEKIDRIIAGKKRLGELLEEKRKSVISEAVEGVGGTQEKLRRFVLTNPSKQEVKLGQGDMVSFLPMEKVSAKGKIKLAEEREYQDVKDGFTYFRNEDVLIAKITPCFENGKGAIVSELKNGIGFGSTEFIVLRSQDELLPKYAYYLTFSERFRKSGEVEMRGSAGQKRVPENFVKDFEFVKPTLEKQKKIVDYLDRKSDEIDNTIKKVKQSIQLLTEYKSSLISHVVTGRVKV